MRTILIPCVLLILTGCANMADNFTPKQGRSVATPDEARQYKDIYHFIEGRISTEGYFTGGMSGIVGKKPPIGRIRQYRHDTSFVSAVNGDFKKQVKELTLPHDQLKVFCEARGGTFHVDRLVNPSNVAPKPQYGEKEHSVMWRKAKFEREVVTAASKRGAFSHMECRKNGNPFWRVDVTSVFIKFFNPRATRHTFGPRPVKIIMTVRFPL